MNTISIVCQRGRELAFAVGLLIAMAPSMALAQAPQSLMLKFNPLAKMEPLTRTAMPSQEVWKHYITEPGNLRRTVVGVQKVAAYLRPNQNICRLQSDNNYVVVARAVDPKYGQASMLAWKWSVAKHPRNGKLNAFPNDSAIQIYVVFREQLPGNQDVFTSICFCWMMRPTEEPFFEPNHELPWRGAPQGDVYYVDMMRGTQQGIVQERVNLGSRYQQVFERKAPPIYAVAVMADCNDLGAKTDAEIGEITFVP